VFVDDRAAAPVLGASADPPEGGQLRVQSAHDFVWRHARGQYDLAVYQLGNSRLHEYIWPYLFQYPGLVVLHDARLHHARARALLAAERSADYRAELAFNHPEAASAAELAIAGFDGLYYYLWPMTRAVLAASRLTAVHTRGGARDLASSWPQFPSDYVALGQDALPQLSPAARAATRAQLGLAHNHVVFGAFGGLTAEKRIRQIVGAFAQLIRFVPEARLLLAGAVAPSLDLDSLIEQTGAADAIVRCGVLDDQAFDDAIAAVDVSLNLRWPTAIETSGPWIRALSAGLPTITIALAHQAHVPSLDPRDWSVSSTNGDPVTVAIDIVDEDHSLLLAMRRLARDATLRAAVGVAGRTYWSTEHTVPRMVEDYERVIARAAALPARDVPLPTHTRPVPDAHVRETLAAFPEVSCALR
jgi:glycosyltransferase involved in cell wall biosynthesis